MRPQPQVPHFRIGGGGGPQRRMMLLAAEKPKHAWTALARLWGYLRHQAMILIAIFVLVVAATGLALIAPLLLKTAIDAYIMRGNLPGLTHIVVLMLAVAVASAAMTWLQSFLMVSVAQRTVYEVRNALFGRLQMLPLRFFDERPTGELMSRFTNDLENVSTTLSDSVSRLFSGLIRILGAAAIMLWVNWRLALLSLATVPLMLWLVKWVSSRTLKGYRDQQAALGALNGLIEESISGARVVKAYACEERAVQAFDEANARLRASATRAMTFAMVLPPLMNMTNNLGYAIMAGVGGWMVVRGWASVGTIIAFMAYAQQFGRPLNELANLFNAVQGALAGAERVFEVIDEEPEMIAPPDALPLARVRGDVVFDDVTFGYEPEVPVLRNVSLQAKPGQRIALVGPTGAGKTTLVNVLSRFYDVNSGAILVDGRDIRLFRKDDLRRQFGIVLQDSFLFSGTVIDNIRYGRPDASEEQAVAAAEVANADVFIRHLPQGYRTQLVERGANLSQGQRQLLTVARAILADHAILILDEATSNVDTRTERHIQEAMRRLMKGRTSLVIAHRLSTIRDADMILVINEGRIVERGRHEGLMARRGFYHDLYMSQFKGQAAPQ
ncbi:MAG: multidrug ABC transporter ATP-binding protein [Planctomycetes bacterium SM23_32]|nr:MAG: multidrug ABC transporter ATP-binding protein [Planctomycetes bacterium SM23_32]